MFARKTACIASAAAATTAMYTGPNGTRSGLRSGLQAVATSSMAGSVGPTPPIALWSTRSWRGRPTAGPAAPEDGIWDAIVFESASAVGSEEWRRMIADNHHRDVGHARDRVGDRTKYRPKVVQVITGFAGHIQLAGQLVGFPPNAMDREMRADREKVDKLPLQRLRAVGC